LKFQADLYSAIYQRHTKETGACGTYKTEKNSTKQVRCIFLVLDALNKIR